MIRTVNPSLFSITGASSHRSAICADYTAYAERKKQWDCQHPDATLKQRDAALMRLAQECGA